MGEVGERTTGRKSFAKKEGTRGRRGKKGGGTGQTDVVNDQCSSAAGEGEIKDRRGGADKKGCGVLLGISWRGATLGLGTGTGGGGSAAAQEFSV